MPLPIANIEVPAGLAVRPGLLTVASGPYDLPTHAQHGAQYEDASCTPSRLYPTACQDPPYPAITYDAREALNRAYAFNVYASEICTPVGTSMAQAEARVRERLRIGEQWAVERALWGGATNVTGIFETLQAAGKVTTLTAGGVVESLSLLEQTLMGAYTGQTIVHARPRMVPFLATRRMFDEGAKRSGALTEIQRSHNGSLFSIGGGYSGNSPLGAVPDATTETIYGTGRVHIWRTKVEVPTDPNQLLNLTNNQRAMFAMRTYAISIECIAAAVTVTRAS